MNRYTNWNVTDNDFNGNRDLFARRNESGYDEDMSDESDMDDDYEGNASGYQN